MKTVIVDYGMGNLRSVQKAVEYIGESADISGDLSMVRGADCLILPGVGAFGDAIAKLNETGLSAVIKEKAAAGTPILGICLGMQLMYRRSCEDGVFEGLGLLDGEVVRFTGDEKIPHMGWNTIEPIQRGLTDNLGEQPTVYFVHSYYAPVNEDTDSVCSYAGVRFSASAKRGNVCATQFHPEKSGDVGLKILKNFFMGAKTV